MNRTPEEHRELMRHIGIGSKVKIWKEDNVDHWRYKKTRDFGLWAVDTYVKDIKMCQNAGNKPDRFSAGCQYCLGFIKFGIDRSFFCNTASFYRDGHSLISHRIIELFDLVFLREDDFKL